MKKGKIRIWTSHLDVYSYLTLLYVSSIIKKYNYELYVVYSEEYNKRYFSSALMNADEMVGAIKLEHKLSNKEITENANEWKKLVKENGELKVLENEKIKSVSINYYNKYILDTLKKIGKTRIEHLVWELMGKIYLKDIMYVYLINRLIKDNKIKITLDENVRYFENIVECV